MPSETHNEKLESFVCIEGAKLSNDKETLLFYEGNNKNYKIPFGVKVVGEKAFAENTQIESVTIPESVKIIKKRAFEKCKALKQVIIKGRVKGLEIGDDCFYQCEALIDITLPIGTQTIGKSVFNSCSSLKQIHIPGSIKEIPENAFEGCENLKVVVLSEGVKEINHFAFNFCSALEEIRLPYSMEFVGSHSFTGLKRCYFDNPQMELEEDAFEGCGDDFRLYLPKGADADSAWKSMPYGFTGRNRDLEKGPAAFGHLYSNLVPYLGDIPLTDI